MRIDRRVGETTSVTMADERGMDPPPIPPMPSINPLVSPKGLSIVVLQNLHAVHMPSHLP